MFVRRLLLSSGSGRSSVPVRQKTVAAAGLIVMLASTGTNLLMAQTPFAPVSQNGARCSIADPGFDPNQVYDTIIVGAGIAGLGAAHELDKQNRSYLLLEANNRIGGRGFVGNISVGSETVPIDYGGAWLHGVPTNPLTPIVDAEGFQRYRSNLDVPFYIGSKRADKEQVKELEDATEDFERGIGMAASSQESQLALAEFACKGARDAATGKVSPAEVCLKTLRAVPDNEKVKQYCAVPSDIKLNKLCEYAETIQKTSDNSDQYLPRNSRFAQVIPLLAGSAGPLESAAELNKTSTVDSASFEAGEDDLTDKGMGNFVVQYGSKTPVCLNARVNRVQYSTPQGEPAPVVVSVNGQNYLAKSVLVTVSVGVLQKMDPVSKKPLFEFAPSLPEEKQVAIKNIAMGSMQKVILPFKSNIFTSEKDNSWVVYQGKLPQPAIDFARANKLPMENGDTLVMAFVIRPLGKNIAIGFFGGDWAKALEGQCAGMESTSGPAHPCDQLALSISEEALSNMYTQKAVDDNIEAAGIQVTRWNLDPTSWGAYSIANPGEWVNHKILAEPVEDAGKVKRLFFAGEGTARAIYIGSYPGAYESGVRAAREINVMLLDEEEK